MNSGLQLAPRDLQLVCEHCNHIFILTTVEQSCCAHFGIAWPQYCRRCRTTFPAPKLLAHTSISSKRSPAVWLAAGALITLFVIGLAIFIELFVRVPSHNTITESGARVTTDYLHLRAGPTKSAQSFGILEPGSELVVLGRSGNWLRVIRFGQEGFVHSAYVALPPADWRDSKEEHRAR